MSFLGEPALLLPLAAAFFTSVSRVARGSISIWHLLRKAKGEQMMVGSHGSFTHIKEWWQYSEQCTEIIYYNMLKLFTWTNIFRSKLPVPLFFFCFQKDKMCDINYFGRQNSWYWMDLSICVRVAEQLKNPVIDHMYLSKVLQCDSSASLRSCHLLLLCFTGGCQCSAFSFAIIAI